MYRFSEIEGYQDVKNHFQSAIRMNKVSHAYMIEGESGMGKKLLANTFAKTLQCEAHGEDACDACQSCLLFDTNNHPDVIHVVATKKTGLGVDDIREQINSDVHIKPYVYDYKIYIIHEADRMSIQAQNAMLKTIEEPPAYVRFVLLASHTHSFLPTVMSRCVLVKLKPIAKDVVEGYLINKVGVPDYQAILYSAFSRGNIGKAVSLKHSEDFNEMREAMIKVMDAISQKSKMKAMEQVDVFEKYGEHKTDFLDLCLTWLRDLMVLKSLGSQAEVIHEDRRNQLLKQMPNMSYNKMNVLIEGIEQILRYDRLHINYTLMLEVMIIRGMNASVQQVR